MNDCTISYTSDWLTYISEKRTTQSAGTYAAVDALGTPMTIEWFMANIIAPELAQAKKNCADLAARVTAMHETNFLRAYPEAASHELFLKPCKALVEDPKGVDWQAIEQTIRETVRGFYGLDMQSFGDALKPLLQDIIVFASIKEDGQVLGYVMASITPSLPYGSVKLISIVVDPDMIHRGLERLLVASLINIVPGSKHIFTAIRPTNIQAMELFAALGFVLDQNPIEDLAHKIHEGYFTRLEYRMAKSGILQEVAQHFID